MTEHSLELHIGGTSHETDAEFLDAWAKMEALGYIYSHGNIEKVHLGWLMARQGVPTKGESWPGADEDMADQEQFQATRTGRLRSAEPMIQNIPIRTEIGRQIRAAFVGEPS